jgi:hypothetical protein
MLFGNMSERSTCVMSPYCTSMALYSGADKSLARPGRKEVNVSVRMARISFGALLCKRGGGGKALRTARVPWLLKRGAYRTNSRACFRPARAKDLSAYRYEQILTPKFRLQPQLTDLKILKFLLTSTPLLIWNAVKTTLALVSSVVGSRWNLKPCR